MKIVEKAVYLSNYLRLYEKFGKLVYSFTNAASYCYEKVFGVCASGDGFDLLSFMAEAENITLQLQYCNNEVEELSCILVSCRNNCRFCCKILHVEKKFRNVTVYDNSIGTTTGHRYTKRCTSCKVSESYGYYVKDNIRVIDLDQFSENRYLMSTEETVFTIEMMDLYQYELHVTCMPFQSKAMIYNQYFKYMSHQKEPPSKASKM